MATITSPDAELSEQLDRFGEWIDDGLVDVQVLFKFEHGNVYCLFEDFNVVGMGTSPNEAFKDATHLVAHYLFTEFQDGRDFVDAARPVPLRLRLEIRRDLLRAGIEHRLRRAASGAKPRVFERTAFLGSDQVTSAVC